MARARTAKKAGRARGTPREQDLTRRPAAVPKVPERKRRDLVVQAIREIPGRSTPVPDGAFYCLVDAKPLMGRFGHDDTKLAVHLLEHGVAVVAASAFGGRNGFRISFAADEKVLQEALDRIAAALRE